ncbi:uncharacterized protein LOC111058370 [Nilaparvata lugens]|uniref:uncharacterized protein LOC111058370 n=1 Tax=Nilaparvata lugens TaxID=108931 RepID=UPI00193D3EBB|nr:uncharacterized protein LOC111058370 [Nilaparvata lugens]
MWGIIGKQPFWPCYIVTDNDGRSYKRKMCSNDVYRISFYVQWMGDGRHSWVGLSYLVPFERAPNPQHTPYDMLKNYIQTMASTSRANPPKRRREEEEDAPRPPKRRCVVNEHPQAPLRRSERIRQQNLEIERAEEELQRLELQHQERQRQRQRRQPMRRLAEMVLPPPPPVDIVGNVMWGRLGKQPYWPAMVAVDEDGLYFKQQLTENGVLRRQFYVEWLADGQRSWVGATYLAPFERPLRVSGTPLGSGSQIWQAQVVALTHQRGGVRRKKEVLTFLLREGTLHIIRPLSEDPRG